MTNQVINVIHRNLQEVFGEGDAELRRAAIEQLYTDDCVLHVRARHLRRARCARQVRRRSASFSTRSFRELPMRRVD